MVLATNVSISLVSVAGFALTTALIRLITLKCGFVPYSYIISFAKGIFVNRCAMLIAARWQVEVIVESKVRVLVQTLMESFCIPIAFFIIGYTVNLNIFKYSKIQVINLGITANLIHTVLLAFLLDNTRLYDKFSATCLLFICTLGMAYTTSRSVELLQNSTVYTKHIEQLLEGEGFLTTLMSIFLLHFTNVDNVTFTQVITRTGLFFNACIVGVIIGLVVGPVVTHIDGIALICFTLGSIFFSMFITMILLGNVIEVAALMLGITIRRIKQSSEKKSESYLDDFYARIFYTIECIVFMISGILSAYSFKNIYEYALEGLLMYFYAILLRGLIWFCWYILMNLMFGVLIPCKIAFICIFAAYKSSLPLLLAFDYLYHIESVKPEVRIGTIITFFVCFHCLFSSLIVPCLCKYSGLTDFSKKRVNRINHLLKRILNQRQKTIETLQRNIISANANWQIVDYLTNIYEPTCRVIDTEYCRDMSLKDLINDSTTDEQSEEAPECQEGIDRWMRKRSSQDLLAQEEMDTYIQNSIRKKVYEMQTNSYCRLFSEETISKKSQLFLTSKWDTPSLEKSWKRKKINSTSSYTCLTKIQDFFQNVKSKPLRKPTNFFRSDLFNVITSSSYRLFLTTIIILDSLSQLLLVYIYYSQKMDGHNSSPRFKRELKPPSNFSIQQTINNKEKNTYANYLQATDHFCYGLFLGEFFFQLLGWGCYQYFQQKIWLVEFSVSIVIRTVEQLMLHSEINNDDILQVDEIIMLLKSFFILRLVVLKHYLKPFCSCIKNIAESWKNRRLMNHYEREYCTAISDNDTLQHYQNIFGTTKTGKKLKKQWLNLRNINKMNMSLLAQINNEVVVAMKSKQVALNVLKDSELYIHELKQNGHILEFEMRILERNFKKIKDRMKNITNVASPKPTNLLQQVYWLRGDQACSNYLLNHAEMVSFKSKERIIDFGKETSGLFIIVSGICRYFYKPTIKSLHKWILLGMLPNSDYFLHLRFKEVQQDLIEPGNLIGELGFITGRPYNVRVLCENNVNALKITYPHLIKLFYNCHFGNIRLAKLWKTIGIRFCIKHFLPYFKILSRESLISQLHKSLVPLLETVKLVNLSDDISEVLLIEGTAKDSLTRCHLTAPLIIKPQGQKLIVNYGNIPNDIPTRLLLIPKLGVNILDIVKSNAVFKDYIKYTRFLPKLFGEDICLKSRKKIKVVRQFLKKHQKYMLIDFMLQTNDPKIGIPCCISSEKEKCIKIKRKKRTRKIV